MASQHSTAHGLDLHNDKRMKEPCRASIGTNVSLSTPGTTIDGVTLNSGDRVLLTGQSNGAQNGIYVWNGATSVMSRASDATNAFDFTSGFMVFVTEGSTRGLTVWLFTTTGAITVGTTTLSFISISGTGATGATGPTGPTGPQGASGSITFTVAGAPPYALIQDQKPLGTNGGTFTAGADQTRTLNVVVIDANSMVVLASNQFTLQAGTYRIRAEAPAFAAVGRHQAMLFNVSDNATVIRGRNAYAAGSTSQTDSIVVGRFAIASAKTFELRHRAETTRSTDGFGVPGSFGTEIYASVELWLEGGPAIPPGNQSLALPTYRRRSLAGTDVDMPPSANTTLPV